MKTFWITVAENDDNGLKSGYASKIVFGDLITFVAYVKGSKFSIVKNDNYWRIRVSRKTYPYSGFRAWEGSMAFNSYRLPSITACELITDIYRSGKYDIDECLTELGKYLAEDGVLMHGDFLRLAEEELVEPEF